jgi:hypothetical protein
MTVEIPDSLGPRVDGPGAKGPPNQLDLEMAPTLLTLPPIPMPGRIRAASDATEKGGGMAFRTRAFANGFLIGGLLAAMASPAAAAPIDIDWPGGDPFGTVPGFTWQGLDFVLEPLPGRDANAAHRVSGDPNGALDIILTEPGKVAYRAHLPAPPAGGAAEYRIDYVYGPDLSEPTPALSFIQPFFRTFDGTAPNTALAGLHGSDQVGGQPSRFSGLQARPDDQPRTGGFAYEDFIDGAALDGVSSLLVRTAANGLTSATVTQDGAVAALTGIDLTNATTEPFYFEDLLLQVGSNESANTFTEQRFTYLDADVRVPEPATVALVGSGMLALAGLGAARARRAA